MSSCARASILALLIAAPVAAQVVSTTVPGTVASLGYGRNLAELGDVDGDGAPDFITGSQNAPNALGHSAAGLAQVFSSRTGAAIYTFNGQWNLQQLGFAVCNAGDVDGDTVSDFAFSQPWFGPPLPPGTGAPPPNPQVFIHSGATGVLIRAIGAPAGASEFGGALAPAGDVDVDLTPDIIAGSKQGNVAHVLSGANGSVILTLTGPNFGLFGRAVAGIGDISGDGIPDVMVAATSEAVGGVTVGVVRIYSGFDGSILRTHNGVASGDSFGTALAGLGDVDGDAVPDYAISAPGVDGPSGGNVGFVAVYSGANGSVVRSWTGTAGAATPNLGETLGIAVRGVGDLDRDGTPDLLIGASGADGLAGVDAGAATLVSIATGAVLARFEGRLAGDGAGTGVSALGDVDGDGWAEVLIGSPRYDSLVGTDVGRIDVVSFGPFLGACGAGIVGGSAAPATVLTVNGSSGGFAHRIDLTANFPITVNVAQPPGNPSPANHLLFAKVGVPAPNTGFDIGFGIGVMCFPPSLLAPAADLFLLASSYPGFGELLAATPAPWSFALPLGLPAPVRVALQPVIEESPGNLRVGNAVLVNVY